MRDVEHVFLDNLKKMTSSDRVNVRSRTSNIYQFMSEYIVTTPRWWNRKGYGVYSPQEKTEGYITYTTESGHLKIRPGPRRDQFLVRSILFQPGDLRTDIPALLSSDELATMFNIEPRQRTANNPEYAELFGGDAGIPGKFFRFENFVNFPCPGTGFDGDPNFSFVLKEFMNEEIRCLIENFKVKSLKS